jgi:hypothetical protein
MDPRVKYFTALADFSGMRPSTATLIANTMSLDVFSKDASPVPVRAGELLLDRTRSVYATGTPPSPTTVFRQVQRTTDDALFWICVSGPTPHPIARMG